MLVNIELPLSKYYYIMINSSIFLNYFFNNPNIKFTFEYIKSFKTKNIFELHSRLKVAAEQNLPNFLKLLYSTKISESDINDDSKIILLSKDIQFDHPLEMYYNFNLIDETFSIKGLEGKKIFIFR